MARNRKYRSAAVRFGPALKAFVCCLLIGGAGVGYVWQKDQIARLNIQIRQREAALKHLQLANRNQRQQLENMQSPLYLELRIKEENLGLALPAPNQVWRLPEPPRTWPATPREPQWAASVNGNNRTQ